MTGWWIETLVWTGLLIGLVLLLRGTVSRHMGPQAAYALWLLPFLRLVLPPLVLPAWLAPAPEAAPEYALYVVDASAAPLDQATAVAAEPAAWASIILAVWLAGAAVFLAVRFTGYFRMRAAMLMEGRPVGEVGAVRLVETPAATAPIAFGVLDKVVALPTGFMAMQDRQRRDLALAHELAHHGANDLLANMAAQPLFALHWFNPLAWLGWRAMRRDQEAACDARVIAQCGSSEKATYAAIIAGFAAGPNVALAAPMACPILGEKSIIHRLRSLTMSDISPRRRLAGRILIGAAVLALPMTATISYAEGLTEPNAPPAPFAPPAPPSAPQAPDAPLMWQSSDGTEFEQVFEVESDGEDGAEAGQKKVRRVIRMRQAADAEGQEKMAKEMEIKIRKLENLAELKQLKSIEAMESLRHLEELKSIKELDGKHIAMIVRKSMEDVPNVVISCEGESFVSETKSKNGRQMIKICTDKVGAEAIKGMKEARAEIAREKELDSETRAEILKSLDEQIATMGKKN